MKLHETTTRVRPINEEKLQEHIRKLVPVKENESLHIRTGALIGENVITDKDCVYHYCEKYFIPETNQVQYAEEVPVRIRIQKEEGITCPLYPSFYFIISLDELAQYLLPAVSLQEYMGTRYNYNPRIKSNMKGLLTDEVVALSIHQAQHGTKEATNA